ncbi:hypothetical protein [Bowmanella yangjiangensis]|uniref:Uncharacterized protein n=1 Tax=Bowmanella yangjiangensis TaxID=2811230 RepID=A0ABS3CTL3_9ALTE|nr:hypothetical protein [Bowmanella yangjiangensis]MBN7819481.1 hypothetical protein [Bowmanella yangjiangensis]
MSKQADVRLANSLLLFLISLIILQIIYFVAANQAHQRQAQTLSLALEKRIALDLPWLRLPNDVMNSVADEQSVRRYLDQLNQQAAENGYAIRALALQGISATEPDGDFASQEQARELHVPGQTLSLKLGFKTFTLLDGLSAYPLLAALLFTLLVTRPHEQNGQQDNTDREPEALPAVPKLVVNLRERTLCNSLDDRQVQLSNKPFCFYVALLEYCLQHENAALNHNKNIPDELLDLANRYFYRLIELGHTIRKRPDFSTNLDKMLSEIRAALDDVFRDCPEVKAPFYPPKAQGEGSRSKLHNYALEQLRTEDLEIIGK